MRISIEHMEWYNFIDKYNNEWKEHLRYGQAFYNYFNLFKMKQTPELDCLYNTYSDLRARDIIDQLFEIH